MKPTAKWWASILRHGEARDKGRSPEYNSWATMIQRCHNPRNTAFSYYGGRGIIVCDRWRHSYQAFLQDMGRRETLKYTLDRIDKDGNYKAANCRWATKSQQQYNRRPPHLRTRCKRGHAFTPENTYVDSRNDRNCRLCLSSRMRRYHQHLEVSLGSV